MVTKEILAQKEIQLYKLYEKRQRLALVKPKSVPGRRRLEKDFEKIDAQIFKLKIEIQRLKEKVL